MSLKTLLLALVLDIHCLPLVHFMLSVQRKILHNVSPQAPLSDRNSATCLPPWLSKPWWQSTATPGDQQSEANLCNSSSCRVGPTPTVQVYSSGALPLSPAWHSTCTPRKRPDLIESLIFLAWIIAVLDTVFLSKISCRLCSTCTREKDDGSGAQRASRSTS
jgi:hypothetical protein